MGCYREGLSSSPFLGGIELLTVWQLLSLNAREREKEREEGRKACVTCHGLLITNPLSEVTSYHYCHVLFIRKESVNLTHTRKEGITQECEYQEPARSLEAILELA